MAKKRTHPTSPRAVPVSVETQPRPYIREHRRLFIEKMAAEAPMLNKNRMMVFKNKGKDQEVSVRAAVRTQPPRVPLPFHHYDRPFFRSRAVTEFTCARARSPLDAHGSCRSSYHPRISYSRIRTILISSPLFFLNFFFILFPLPPPPSVLLVLFFFAGTNSPFLCHVLSCILLSSLFF